jgi:hypothetical protein
MKKTKEEILNWLDTKIRFAQEVNDKYDSTYRSAGAIRAYREIKKQILKGDESQHENLEDWLNMSKKYIGYDSGNTFLAGYQDAIMETFKEYIK